MLVANNIVKEYFSAAGPLRILDGVSLSIQGKDSIAIIGPSGSGKSTFLNILGTLDKPTTGDVLFEGQDITKLNETELAKVRNQKIGFVFQSHYLLPQCSVLENVLVPTLPAGRASEATERARMLLQKVGLGQRMDHKPASLSGGEKQRVAVVRALINQPKVLLADEPTGALDKNSANSLADLLVELNKDEAIALILVTHSLDLAKRTSVIYELNLGKLVKVAA